ncbi:hypothetical protein FIV42_20220 [Persicimonas caeni]|uniref:IPT/TIG domain-containing protein n=1 Tax=Persicimonas caeni TaxID=2292766 RepID=A0A4Y6PXE8_PERCE|nr:IPT/TIG domain-containing protein [Persicimonas caeni]QDG52986.1 hypothetical protein FIV42_20220 [Persicimonas caeni]QED34208.1 hypothetical protein FRD00_20215 [Persicimonas caeni]
MLRASLRRIPVLFAVLLVLASACSDDTEQGDAGVIDAGADATTPDTTSPDTDAGPDLDATDGPDDVRQPRDTDDEWNWDVGGDTAEQPFFLEKVVPPSGPVDGGNRVRLVGTGFEPGTRVFFGSREMSVDVASQQMLGRVPSASGPGPVTIKAISPGGETQTLVDGYEYVQGLSIDSVSPSLLPTDGGVEVEIRGSGFGPQAAVSFSGEPALRVTFVDAELLRVVAPPRRRGYADVRVTTPAESKVAERAVEYFAPLEISRVAPASGPVAGGQTVTVEGEGFSSSTRFFFGGEPAEIQSIDPQASTATLLTPAGSAGLVDVSAENSRDSTIFEDGYLYRADDAATLAALSPGFGPASGGTEVLLRGNGFDGAGVEFVFGTNVATVVDRGATWARVQTPAGAVGTVDVVMRDANGEIDRLASAFEYRQALWVDAVAPQQGPADGGTSVTLTGTGFAGTDRVEFGGIAAPFTVVSDSEIEATTPAHGAGSVDVVVERDGVEARLRDGFLYTEQLEIWGFTPIRGSIAGNTYVEVRGRGLYGALRVFFDSEEAPVVQRIDRNNLLLYTPPHQVGEAQVSVEAGSQQADAPYPYEYFNPASRFGGASGGAVDGAVNVSVYSRGGGPIPGAFVMLSTRGDTQYQGVTDANGQVTLSGPDVLGPQTVTATAKDFSSATIETVDAENVTLFLTYIKPDPSQGGGGGNQGPPSGIIRGEVSTEGKLSDPENQNTYDMAIVGTTQEAIYSYPTDPGPGAVVLGSGQYEIRSRIGDLAVVALCGVYNDATDTFDPQFMGVERYMFVSDGGEYEADILCNIPLDNTATVKLINPVYSPTGPDTNLVRSYWDFGFEGIFESPLVGRGLSDILQVPRQPEPTGILSDLSFTFVGGSFTGTYSPSTQTQLRDITDLSQTIVLPPLLDVPEPVSPAIGGTVENNTITFQAAGPYYPDFYSVTLVNSDGMPFWQFVIPGTDNTIRLPDFPDFSFLPPEVRPNPMETDRIYMTVIGIRAAQGFAYEGFSYQDLSFDAWRAYSLTRWSFLPPAP